MIIGGLVFGFYYFFDMKKDEIQTGITPETQDGVISYISKNISNLSPEKETLGGTFYVTNITLDRGEGTVEYEDGHNAHTANFEYSFDEKGAVRVINFVIVQ